LKVVSSLEDLRRARSELEGPVGFVPTMGALHRGHQTLMESAKERCRSVVVSVFVNPTQFGPGEDFQEYPRTGETDRSLCERTGVDVVWFPEVDTLYPKGHQTVVRVDPLQSKFEGASRPGHFQGVATVVCKLFGAVQADFAFFGEKDLQQLTVIKRMVADLLIPTGVIGLPTVRESDGLALSSRNRYLTAEQREKAPLIHRALAGVAEEFGGGERSARRLRGKFLRILATWEEADVERFDLLDFQLTHRFQGEEEFEGGYCSVAVRVGKVRLIDNIKICS